MTDLFSVIHNGARSLGAHRTAMATASHNLENASTDGYARQRVSLTTSPALNATPAGSIGTGVRVEQITQARDRFIEARIPGLRSEFGFSAARDSTLDAISSFDSEGGAAVATRLGDLFASLQQLQTRPADPSVRRAAVGAAGDFVRAIGTAAADLATAKSSVDVDLRARAPEIQQLADRVASLNNEIAIARGNGGPPNDLLDQRQVAIDALAEQVGARIVPGDDPAVTLTLPGGQPLVVGNRAARVDVGTASDGRLLLSVGGTDGAPPRLLDQRDVGGTVGGLLEARDVDLAAVETQLDTFAFDIAGAFNAAHSGGIALDGSTGRPLFSLPATSQGAARLMRVETTIAADPNLLQLSSTGATGDAGALQAILQVRDAAVAGATDPFSALATITSSIGERSRSAGTDRLSAQSLLNHGVGQRDSVSGVSIDEELVNLQQAERAFQAATKVISTADQMMQTILDLR